MLAKIPSSKTNEGFECVTLLYQNLFFLKFPTNENCLIGQNTQKLPVWSSVI